MKFGELKIAQSNTQHTGIFTNVFIRHVTYNLGLCQLMQIPECIMHQLVHPIIF